MNEFEIEARIKWSLDKCRTVNNKNEVSAIQ